MAFKNSRAFGPFRDAEDDASGKMEVAIIATSSN
jgi:hypothetical protein